MSARHRDALAHLIYGVGVGGGFILLTGEVGTGKTTITRCLLEQLPEQTDIAMIFNPALNAVELLAALCDELHIDYDSGDKSLKGLSDKLHQFLLANHQRGRNTVLLIDEAQHLQIAVLEQVRLLTNLETNTRKLLQIILVGQPELVTMLARPELRQLSQRITARYQLKPFSLDETGNYIRHRLQVAGLHANQELFPPRVVKYIYQVSGGIPRLINVLCDRILLGTYGQNKVKVDMAMARQAVTEVKGEDDELAHTRSVNKWPIAIAGLVLAAVAALLWWQLSSRQALIEPAPAPLAVNEIGQAPALETPAAVVVVDSEPEIEPVPGPEALLEPDSEPEPELEPEPEPEQAPELFFGTQTAALNQMLLATDAVTVAYKYPCGQLAKRGWRCEVMEVRSWAELLSFNSPVVLEILTPGRMKAWAALVAVSADEAILATVDGDHSMPLAQLGELWTGAFLLPWQAPPAYYGPIRTGDEGEAVAWLSQQFARLDGQAKGLADNRYNQLLQQRVMLFQREQSLMVDGAAGLQTLLRIEQQLGDAPTLVTEPTDAMGEH